VQLRSRGFDLDRDGAFRFMMEEAVLDAQVPIPYNIAIAYRHRRAGGQAPL
jgi:hypothetical protein